MNSYGLFIKAQQKAQEVAPIIMKRYQYAEDIVSKIPEVSGNVVIMNRTRMLRRQDVLIVYVSQQFELFANQVIEHIETYTVPSIHGDYPNVNEEWTPEHVLLVGKMRWQRILVKIGAFNAI